MRGTLIQRQAPKEPREHKCRKPINWLGLRFGHHAIWQCGVYKRANRRPPWWEGGCGFVYRWETTCGYECWSSWVLIDSRRLPYKPGDEVCE